MYRPDDGNAYPVILGRTPYNKQLYDPYRPWQLFADRGYIVLVQDCRGRNASDGVFYPFLDEMQDGYDSVEWAASQKWSTGSIGMFGTSYLGVTQWMAAAAAPQDDHPVLHQLRLSQRMDLPERRAFAERTWG